jgi:hypothetical protein
MHRWHLKRSDRRRPKAAGRSQLMLASETMWRPMAQNNGGLLIRFAPAQQLFAHWATE